jgi:hypothetical protein
VCGDVAILTSYANNCRARPENTVGIPMVKPANKAEPPRYSAYKAAEDTVTKNAN